MTLKETTARIVKKHGAGSVFLLGDKEIVPANVISTGVLSLDLALGVGGIPRGRVTEAFGPESSGKTTLTLHTIAECQKAGGTAVFIDAEHALDTSYATKLGVNVEKLLVSQPDYGEQALTIAEDYIRSGDVDLVVIDSVAALSPRAEIEGEIGDSQMGLQARMLSQAMRKLAGVLSKSNCILFFLNQLRSKIGVVYGNPEVTTGGNALKFYSSVRLDIRRISAIKVDEHTIGARTRIKVVKNKCSPPFKEVEIDLVFGRGFDRTGDLVDLGVNFGFLAKSGSWFSMPEEKNVAQGRAAMVEYIQSHPDVATKLEKEIRAKL